MLAYSSLQQREFNLEQEHGYRAVKHQAFVGAGYFDGSPRSSPPARLPFPLCRLHGTGAVHRGTPVFNEAEIHHVAGDDVVPVVAGRRGSTCRTDRFPRHRHRTKETFPCSTHFNIPPERSSRRPKEAAGCIVTFPRTAQGHGPGRTRGKAKQVRQHPGRFRAHVSSGQVHEKQRRQFVPKARARPAGEGPVRLGQ